MNEYLSAAHISGNLDDYEAARSGFFTLLVGTGANYDASKYGPASTATASTDTINLLPKATSESGLDVIPAVGENTAQKIIAINVVKASVPHFSVDVLSYKRGNQTIKFAGTPSFGEGRIVVDDVVGLDTKGILLAWKAQTYNVHNHKGGRMKNYKKTCTLIEYTQDYEQIRKWELRGCWISELSEDDFDKESDGKRQITATIQYDEAIPVEKDTITE